MVVYILYQLYIFVSCFDHVFNNIQNIMQYFCKIKIEFWNLNTNFDIEYKISVIKTGNLKWHNCS